MALVSFRFHYHMMVHSDMFEKATDKNSQNGSHGIEQKRDPGQLGHTHRSRLRAAGLCWSKDAQ